MALRGRTHLLEESGLRWVVERAERVGHPLGTSPHQRPQAGPSRTAQRQFGRGIDHGLSVPGAPSETRLLAGLHALGRDICRVSRPALLGVNRSARLDERGLRRSMSR